MFDDFKHVADVTTFLPEDLLLLCASPEHEGRIRTPTYLAYALGGAVLAELVLAGAVGIDGKRAHLVQPGMAFRHPALTAALASLPPAAPKPRGASLSSCVSALRHRVAGPYLDSLTAYGLLRADQVRVLGIFPRTRHTLTDPSARASRVARIDSVLASPSAASPRDRYLTTLAATAGLTNHLRPTRPDRPTRRLLTDLTRADPLSSAVASAISAAQSSSS
ncbi:GOLPH3/VPS74 family protein [Streptacidiphilus rugosus]|uniref:GOLPH3/VPS74 family protein n=1 Tax=Streptacidiphilus rugosus TaxID=405783 RepID=UPI00068BFD0D|nr:GPP34 family phosphoprotein [Streptacidiphilus rugosus]